jgi:hypothetical protein
MKRQLSLFFCAAALIGALSAMPGNLAAQSTWNYPVKPGMPEWATFTTHDQMVKAIRIPNEVLNSLTTAELVELCLDYPLYGDIFAYNSLQDGLRQNIILCSNGVQELFRRQDNAQCLLNALKNYDLLTLESRVSILTDLEIGESVWKHSFLEVLTSHESVLANANAGQRREIAAIAAKNMLIKERGADKMYGSQGLEASAYLLGATLKSANVVAVPSPELEMFLRIGSSQDVTALVEELMNNYVKF